ncbi:Uma2 family endonuclease [Nocardia sp. NPDC048505]|uniref:Uma2 family endonuclease n=1 Tax=Nocardia sp. NPDC048505 TaxID=3155756 RepID=UPI0033D59A5F
MTTVHSPDHLLSLEEWDALPEDNSRHYELVEGVLVVSPKPKPHHQRVGGRLFGQLDAQLNDAWVVVPECEVVVDRRSPATVRVPDLVVVRAEVFRDNPARFDPADVLVAVEIFSKGTKRADRVTKYFEYAEAGIRHYWLIDPEAPLSLTAYLLVDGEYERVGESAAPMTIELDGFQVLLDLPMLDPAA